MTYIDTHSHLHFAHFDSDRDEVMDRMRQNGVSTIAVGTGLQTSKGAVELALAHPDIVRGATVGVHPTDYNETFTPADYEPLLALGVVRAVGECGLDYYRQPREEVFEKQKPLFEAQIEFALKHKLPLMLHVRPSKGTNDAHDDALAILKANDVRRRMSHVAGTAHFFTGSLACAQQYWALGFCTSFPGVITFASETHEVVREAPIDKILSETDAPYAAPVPYRGMRAEPTHVVQVAQKIADIRGVSETIIAEQLLQNAHRVFSV